MYPVVQSTQPLCRSKAGDGRMAQKGGQDLAIFARELFAVPGSRGKSLIVGACSGASAALHHPHPFSHTLPRRTRAMSALPRLCSGLLILALLAPATVRGAAPYPVDGERLFALRVLPVLK